MKVTKLIGIIILVIAAIYLLANYVFYDRYKMPEGAVITISDKKVEVFDENTNLYDLITDSNVEIITENSLVDTYTIGEKTITIVYKYNGIRKYKYDVKYEVIDTVAPIYTVHPTTTRSFFVNESSQEDFDKIISKINYADNYDIYPTLEIKGEVNFEEVGVYPVDFTIKDSSGNSKTETTEVTIKERPVETKEKEKKKTEPEEEDDDTVHFEDFIQEYKTDKTLVGIDVSKWQGAIDFDKVKEAGCEFVIIRMGVMKDKDSELVKDNTFDDNYKNAKKAGLKVGIYVYSEANNVKTAISNAEFVINELKGDKLDFPIAFDWESWSYFNKMEMNLHMLNEMYEAFRDRLKEDGYEAMLYGSQNHLNGTWLDLKDYTLWAARYYTKPPEIFNGNKFIIWQNACTGVIDGINGNVDLDIYYK